MKNHFLALIIFILAVNFSIAQTAVLYNSNPLFYTDGGAVVFVDGSITNDTSGHIQNNGDIYLTKDWINNEVAGALDATKGKVLLAGTTQNIKGAQTTTFNNLDCNGTGLKTLEINTIVGGSSGVLSLKIHLLHLIQINLL